MYISHNLRILYIILSTDPPVDTPPITSKTSHGFKILPSRMCWPPFCMSILLVTWIMSSLMIYSAARPRMPPPSAIQWERRALNWLKSSPIDKTHNGRFSGGQDWDDMIAGWLNYVQTTTNNTKLVTILSWGTRFKYATQSWFR